MRKLTEIHYIGTRFMNNRNIGLPSIILTKGRVQTIFDSSEIHVYIGLSQRTGMLLYVEETLNIKFKRWVDLINNNADFFIKIKPKRPKQIFVRLYLYRGTNKSNERMYINSWDELVTSNKKVDSSLVQTYLLEHLL